MTFHFTNPSAPESSFGSSNNKKQARNCMFWTEEHDKLLCREILAVDPFTGTKKGTPQRGAKWSEVADNLSHIDHPSFRVDARAVRERYKLLSEKLRKKVREEQKASGISTDMSEVENALENIIEKEDAAYAEDAVGKKEKENNVTAEETRKAAMERLGQTQKRKESEDAEGKRKKSTSNGSDTLMYLREKNDAMKEMKMHEINEMKNLKGEEMDLKKRELDLQAKRHDDMMRVLVQQQQQQAKATQDFQTMVLAILSKMGQK